MSKCWNEKMTGQKKSRAFRIHSNMSRHEMPNKLKKNIVSCWEKHQNINKCRNEKTTGQKKSSAFRFHSKTSRLGMPNKTKKEYSFMLGKNQNINKCWNEEMTDQKKVGHSKSTQIRVDTKCPIS